MAKTNNLPPGVVKARVISAGQFGKVDDVAIVDEKVAALHPDLDPSPEAVAYAELRQLESAAS